MRSFLVAMLVGAALGGCAEQLTSIDEPDPLEPDKPVDEIGASISLDPTVDEHEISERRPAESAGCVPPADDGPCSLLCDPDELLETYVAQGTCIQFLCTLRDGTRSRLGGCR